MPVSVFKPDDPFPKKRGDNVRSKDWNDVVNEVLRLGTAKVDDTGDTINGNLNITGTLGVGLTNPQQMLSVNGSLSIDQANANDGKIQASGLTLGNGSGEGIASKRTAGGNHFGLDLYTNFQPRLSITQDGRVGIGTVDPGAFKFNVVSNTRIKLGLEGMGGGQLQLACNANDDSMYLEAYNHDGTASAKGFLLTGIAGTPVPSLSLVADQTNVTGNLQVSGNINAPKFRVTHVFNQRQGPLPLTGSFASGGGTLLIIISGSCWTTGLGTIGIVVQIDGSSISTARTFTNESSSHKALVSNPMVQRNVNAGNHTLTFAVLTNTVTDANDFFSATVLELPF